jgi:formate-dependent nitrite reductase membrane component NrfD
MSRPTLVLYEDLEAVYRPQRVWAEGRAIALVIAHFLSGVGAGGWLIGVVLGIPLVLSLSVAAIVLSGVVHLGFLGHPERAWKMIRRPASSWISRGLWSIMIFLPTAALYLAGAYGAWSTRGAFAIVMLVISLAAMAGIFLYKGFVYSVSRAVALWHSPLLPVSYIAIGVRGGAALGLIALAFVSGPGGHLVQTWWIAATCAAIFLFLLEVASGRGDSTVERSLGLLYRGALAWLFYGAVVVLGIVVPAALVIASYPASIGAAGLIVAGILSLAGDMAYKYCMNTAGTYVPIVQAGRR